MSDPQQYQHQSSIEDNTSHPAARPQFWKYLLTVLITAFLTFTLTAAGGLALYVTLAGQNGNAGSQTGGNTIRFDDDESTAAAVEKLKDVLAYLDENYYEDLTDAQLLEAMTSGLVDEIGSRYTMYLTAEQYNQIEESMSGEYVGIGALVAMNNSGYCEITEVLAGSPAQEAGIQAGDVFIKVNDVDVTGYDTIDEVAADVKGEAGTEVKLTMYRAAEDRNIDFTVTRRKITNSALISRMLTETVGYVQIRDFSAGVAELFAGAMQDLVAQGATRVVFDMRNNSGGRADEVIAMLDDLLPEATIATVKGRSNGKEFSESWTSDKAMLVPADMRYAILVNGNTASAAELFSGCLQDYGKAWLIGEQTFGKGSGTQSFLLEDGSAINVTIFLYYLPGGDCIEEIGLTPDQAVALPAGTESLSISQLTLEQDTQLAAALAYLETLD